ncbi:MAG: hypothetical protein ACI4S3_09720 [Candidatus Gastranaerophilaceae bacterium]
MKKLRSILPVTVTMTVIYTFMHTGCAMLKYYPVIMNFFFFITFTISSFQKETMLYKIAKKLDNEITEEFDTYMRNFTYIWILVTFTNLIISFSTLFMSDRIWALYNGCISYLFIGTVLAIEYPIRLIYKRKLKCIVE